MTDSVKMARSVNNETRTKRNAPHSRNENALGNVKKKKKKRINDHVIKNGLPGWWSQVGGVSLPGIAEDDIHGAAKAYWCIEPN
jgi:hypothetical protein